MLTYHTPSHFAQPGEVCPDALQATAAADYQRTDARHGRYLIMAPLAADGSGQYAGADILSGHHSPQAARRALAAAQRRLARERNKCRRALAHFAGPYFLALVDSAGYEAIEWADIPTL